MPTVHSEKNYELVRCIFFYVYVALCSTISLLAVYLELPILHPSQLVLVVLTVILYLNTFIPYLFVIAILDKKSDDQC